jgi:DNA processing protein
MSPDLALLTLSRARLPDALLRHLLEQHPNPEVALAAAVHGAGLDLPAPSRAWLRRPDRRRLEADLAWLSGAGRRLVAWSDPDYPTLLRRSPGAPPLLFVRGDPTLLWSAQVGIVGSRRPSAGGRDHARRFARALAGAGWTVTSGLAQGVDTAAHEGALDVGRTVAVVGTGLDLAYPPENAALMARIGSVGAIVSEHPPGTDALPTHFPSRNRIIAGLSLGTLVVEAASRSGALITARLAAEAGREVFALPGSIGNPLARGCHRLIRDGAALVEGPEEIVTALAPLARRLAEMLRGQLGDGSAAPDSRSAVGQSPDDPDHSRLWSALGHDPTGMDVLAERTGLTVAALSSMLLLMELEGHVVNDHGRYARRP